jgi:hypothetical protein
VSIPRVFLVAALDSIDERLGDDALIDARWKIEGLKGVFGE